MALRSRFKQVLHSINVVCCSIAEQASQDDPALLYSVMTSPGRGSSKYASLISLVAHEKKPD